MIQNPKLIYQMEDKFIRDIPVNYEKNRLLFEFMWKEAIALAIFPPKEPLQGIEIDIELARILNSCLKNS